jgi:zinc resistance-associated protein
VPSQIILSEENMWKSVVAATAALAIAGSSIVYAQQRFGENGYGDGSHRHHHMSAEDRAAFVDARIAALKAGLELTADQAKNWPAYEQALRDMAKLRAERRAAREAREQNPGQTPAPFDRLAQRADNMAKASAVLKRIAETGQPLYMSLNDAQKERFQKLARMLRPHHHHMHGRFEERGQGWRDGQGYGRGDGERGGRSWHHGQRFGQDGGWQGGRMRHMSDEQGTRL